MTEATYIYMMFLLYEQKLANVCSFKWIEKIKSKKKKKNPNPNPVQNPHRTLLTIIVASSYRTLKSMVT